MRARKWLRRGKNMYLGYYYTSFRTPRSLVRMIQIQCNFAHFLLSLSLECPWVLEKIGTVYACFQHIPRVLLHPRELRRHSVAIHQICMCNCNLGRITQISYITKGLGNSFLVWHWLIKIVLCCLYKLCRLVAIRLNLYLRNSCVSDSPYSGWFEWITDSHQVICMPHILRLLRD